MHKLDQQIPRLMKRILSKVRPISRQIKYAVQAQNAQINPKPIIILGNQKAGTSAIAALLAENTGLSVTIDLIKEVYSPTYHRVIQNQLPFADFVRMHKLEFSRDIVKEPNFTLLYQQLVAYFPHAKFVFIVRDPRDNIRSILNRLKIPGNLDTLTSEYKQEVTPAWELIIDNKWLKLAGENYIEMLAARWNYTTDVYLQHQDQMILVRYEEFLKDKQGEIAKLAQNLELKPVNDITKKMNVQFQPGGDRNVKWAKFFGQHNLSRIEQICGARMKLLDYQISSQL